MCFDLTHAPVATAARAAATGLVNMSTRPDPLGSGTVEIATRRCPHVRVVRNLHDLTHSQKPRLWSLPASLGPVTIHPTRWGVGCEVPDVRWWKPHATRDVFGDLRRFWGLRPFVMREFFFEVANRVFFASKLVFGS